MILTVTPNPALDTSYRVGELAVGGVMRADAPATRAGGKGLNVARVLSQCGEPALALTTMGGPVGDALAAELHASGIRCRLVPVGAETRRSIAIIDDAGRATVVNERGHRLTEAEAEALTSASLAALDDADVLVISGSLPPGFAAERVGRLVTAAQRAGAVAIVDTAGDGLLAACAAGADVVKPNRDELRETVGEGDPVRGARRLLELGARLVVVSLGEDGMLAVGAHSARTLRARPPAPVKGNPTGAGDAAVAALAAGARRDGLDDLVPLLRRAVAWSVAAVKHPLAGSLAEDWDTVEPLVTFEENEQ